MNTHRVQPSSIVAGADVFKGRWIVVVLENGAYHQAVLIDRLDDLPHFLPDLSLLALDIPIGLPADGAEWPRPADVAARAFIRPLSSSVFATPPRPVFAEENYAAGNALHRRLTTKGLSRQSWSLRDRVLEAEFFVGENPNTIEVHPEVCFRAMKGDALKFRKKTWNGQMERRALLADQGIDLPDQLDELTGKAPPDDLLDAAAAAWSAWRCINGQGKALSGSDCVTPLSERGVIWY